MSDWILKYGPYIIIILIATLSCLIYAVDEQRGLLSTYEMCTGHIDEALNKTWADGATGMYFGDYYCVWTGGQSEKQINNTDAHEMCHHFIKMDEKHFCGE